MKHWFTAILAAGSFLVTAAVITFITSLFISVIAFTVMFMLKYIALVFAIIAFFIFIGALLFEKSS